MFDIKGMTPELEQRILTLQAECLADCLGALDKHLDGETVFVALSVHYDVVLKLLLGMGDALGHALGCTPEQTADILLDYTATGINLYKEHVAMEKKANVAGEGRA